MCRLRLPFLLSSNRRRLCSSDIFNARKPAYDVDHSTDCSFAAKDKCEDLKLYVEDSAQMLCTCPESR
jgi:hypothetical protein